MAVMASLQGSGCCLEGWGGRVGQGRALGGVGEARGGRWPWVRRRWRRAPLGGVRERETEEGMGSRGREGRCRGRGRLRGVADGVQGDERKQEVARGKQEVAEASRARATPRLCSSSWQRRKRTRGRRWAGPAGPVLLGHQMAFTGKSRWFCSPFFCSVCFISFILPLF